MHNQMYMLPNNMPYNYNLNYSTDESRLWGGFGWGGPWGWGRPWGFGVPFGFGFGFPFFGFPFFI